MIFMKMCEQQCVDPFDSFLNEKIYGFDSAALIVCGIIGITSVDQQSIKCFPGIDHANQNAVPISHIDEVQSKHSEPSLSIYLLYPRSFKY